MEYMTAHASNIRCEMYLLFCPDRQLLYNQKDRTKKILNTCNHSSANYICRIAHMQHHSLGGVCCGCSSSSQLRCTTLHT